MTANSTVLAAGAVVWHELPDGRIEILVVYRTQHRDLSLPKGKVDPGESLPQTAAREVEEETGLALALGVPLGTVDYTLPNGRPKRVYYWAAEADRDAIANSTFRANDEIEELRWVSLDAARELLTYEHDVDVVDRFAGLVATSSARTFAIIALRHGKAVAPHEWRGPDASRPLMPRGHEQAHRAAAGIAAFRPRKLISSTAARCLTTIAPVAAATGLPVKLTEKISQDAFQPSGKTVNAIVRKRLKRRRSVVLCSHGPVLPQIIEAVASHGGERRLDQLPRAKALGTGEFAVLHVAADRPDAGIVAIEVHNPFE